MQSRYRSPRDGYRPGPPATSTSRLPPYPRDPDRPTPNPYQFPRKIDILMEAGRLAAGYLVSRGAIPPDVLRRNFPNGSPPGFDRPGREFPPPAPEARTSVLARLGQRFDDEGRFSPRRRENSNSNSISNSNSNSNSRKRPGAYSRVYDSDWGRESGSSSKSRNWIERVEEGDEFALGFSRNRRRGFGEIKSTAVRLDEQSGSASEKENDDNWSKASSSSTKKDQQPEADEGSSRGVDEVRVSSSEITEEVKSEGRDEAEKKELVEEEDMDSKTFIEEGDVEMGDCKNLLKLCSFTKVPTKPRSSLANKSPRVDEDVGGETSEGLENAGEEELEDLDCKDIRSSEIQTPDENHSHPSDNSLEEDRTLHDKQFQSNSGTCIKSLSETHDAVSDHEIDERRNKDNSFPSQIIPDTFELTEPVLIGKGSRDKVIIQEAIESGLNSTAFVPKPKRESSVMMEEDIRPENSASFKICDLNLNGSPEMNDIPGGSSVVDHFPSAPTVNKDKGVSANLSMPLKNAENACDNDQIFAHNKVVPKFELEEDPHAKPNTFDSSKQKSDISYTGLESVLNQASHAVDLPGIQEGYSLEFSEFLGSDISVCPSAQGDLNVLQPGMSLHGTEGYPGVDDPIYVSLDELPIGFMGVWDQPSQDYGKFF